MRVNNYDVMEGKMITVNTNTKIIGLLGYPLEQSYSPIMQNAALEHCSLNKIYIPIEVLPENLGTVVQSISKMNFDGFNVTIPYKIEIIKYLDEIDEYAKCIGAVNTVTIRKGILKGYNTDGQGFLKSYEKGSESTIEGKIVFVLGSGGASRGICMTLAFNKAKKIYICNRTYEKAIALAKDINNQVKECSIPVPMINKEMEKAVNNSDVLINTTSVGMFPDVDDTPLVKSVLNEKLIVCDAIYNPKKTRLLREAEEIGCKTVNGLAMLVYQGVESFKLWTGINAPQEIMFKIVDESLK